GFPDELAEIGGFLSLAFFEDAPMTVDYPHERIVLETSESLDRRREEGSVVPVRIERDGPSVTVFCPLTIRGDRSIEVEVDMGSDALILDDRLAGELGIDLDAPEVRCVEGVDETRNAFTRYFTRLEGDIYPTGAAELAQAAPDVMFQRVIYDGLVGDAFMRRLAVTYD